MSQILNKVRELDPHDVDAAKEALSTFFPNLAKHKDGDCVRWLRTLENVINRFPKLCGSQRATIEKYITNFLDTNSYSAVIEAAKCAHVLQQVRPGQEKAATPKVCWRELMGALCNAVHSLISEMFPNAANIYTANGESEHQSSNSVLLSALNEICAVSAQEHLDRENVLCIRLRNVFVFIQAMLVEVYPVGKPVRPQPVLEAAVRALAAGSGAALGSELACAVRQQALRSLDALVACLGSNLIPFSPVVFKCVMQTLRWTSDNPSEHSSVLRSAAYRSLARWLAALRAHAPPRGGHELRAHVARDVTPRTTSVQLTMSNPPRNLSKKQKKKQARVSLQQSSIAALAPAPAPATSGESDDQTAIAALECTEVFLTVSGIFLEPAVHKSFHELLVRECFHLDDYSGERALVLLRALEASRRSAPPGVPPPTQYCLQLYSAGVNAHHAEISKFCSQALLDIRLHLHCSPPSLNFAAEVQAQTEKDAEDKRTITRRNREALESLLGADKVPPESSDVEEAPEPEEPASKKPRVHDVSDKISLSSASDRSVEICESDSEIEEVPVVSETSILEVHAEIHKNNEDSPEIDHQGSKTIHEQTTQAYDTVDGESLSGRSDEVGYGYATTLSVPVLENLEGENLPNTDETDDVHITCGQAATTPDQMKDNCSGDVKVNGVKSPDADQNVVEGSVTVKMVANGVSVEDMLADFVDEVNEDLTQA